MVDELRKVRAALAAGITKAELAERSEVSRRTLDFIDDPNWNPQVGTISALARAAEQLAAERIQALKSAVR